MAANEVLDPESECPIDVPGAAKCIHSKCLTKWSLLSPLSCCNASLICEEE